MKTLQIRRAVPAVATAIALAAGATLADAALIAARVAATTNSTFDSADAQTPSLEFLGATQVVLDDGGTVGFIGGGETGGPESSNSDFVGYVTPANGHFVAAAGNVDQPLFGGTNEARVFEGFENLAISAGRLTFVAQDGDADFGLFQFNSTAASAAPGNATTPAGTRVFHAGDNVDPDATDPTPGTLQTGGQSTIFYGPAANGDVAFGAARTDASNTQYLLRQAPDGGVRAIVIDGSAGGAPSGFNDESEFPAERRRVVATSNGTVYLATPANGGGDAVYRGNAIVVPTSSTIHPVRVLGATADSELVLSLDPSPATGGSGGGGGGSGQIVYHSDAASGPIVLRGGFDAKSGDINQLNRPAARVAINGFAGIYLPDNGGGKQEIFAYNPGGTPGIGGDDGCDHRHGCRRRLCDRCHRVRRIRQRFGDGRIVRRPGHGPARQRPRRRGV